MDFWERWYERGFEGTCEDCVHFQPCPHCGVYGICDDTREWVEAAWHDCDGGEYSDEAIRRFQQDAEVEADMMYDAWRDEQLLGED